MKTFDNIKFKWTFRDYQQKVLDGANKHISDGKVNIVAAPGSGKTILGLELIRRLNSPCLILSPTTTIRQQWGERFQEAFLNEKENINDYISYDLNEVKLLTSITYQALHSAINKIECVDEDESIDYSNIDIMKLIKSNHIKTICLDEAHHLQNEWQKALEKFISKLNEDIKIISLTATPPYDANTVEWQRYMSVSGEIDEEIFVPELVKTSTLCPHQDYIYFNYPTDKEIEEFRKYTENAYKLINEVTKMDMIFNLCEDLNKTYKDKYDVIYENAKQYIALLSLFKYASLKINKKLIKCLTTKNNLPKFNLKYAEIALQFLVDSETLSVENKELLLNKIKEYSLYERKEVKLELNEKLKRKLVSSIGKLKSINSITTSEINNLKDNLRMLVLTDYIKKETIANIGTDKEFNNISVVSVFETIRRSNPSTNIGVLSGTLVILPNNCEKYLKETYPKGYTRKVIDNTNYYVYNFKGENRDKVAIVGKLFSLGLINILVGTKSLLGEGWDSPCINSLILASFVGSFMLSNQMRGRAIRIDKNNPNKVSNIWHLATIEPDYIFKDNKIKQIAGYITDDKKKIKSSDYETLQRRFECFVGPHYTSGEIENRVDRISIIKPPFDEEKIESINKQMLELASKREKIATTWNEALVHSTKLTVQNEVPKDRKIPSFTFYNIGLIVFLLVMQAVAIATMLGVFFKNADFITNTLTSILSLLIIIVLIFITVYSTRGIISHLNPYKSIKSLSTCLLKTLKELFLIESGCRLKVTTNEDKTIINVRLVNASVHDQNTFNLAIKEMLSPIENPRYILVKKTIGDIPNYMCSFACPSIIGKRKEFVQELVWQLRRNTGRFKLIYTRNEMGRKIILKCRRSSYITYNAKQLNSKNKVSKYE